MVLGAFLADGVGPFERLESKVLAVAEAEILSSHEKNGQVVTVVGPAAMPTSIHNGGAVEKGAFSFLDGFQFAAQFGQTADPFAVPFVHLGQALFGTLVPVGSTVVEATFLHRDKCYHAGDVADEGKVDDFQHQVEIVALGGEHLLLRFLVHLVARGVEPLLVALHLKFHAAHVGQVVVQFLLVLPAEPTVEALGFIRDVVEYALVTRLHVPNLAFASAVGSTKSRSKTVRGFDSVGSGLPRWPKDIVTIDSFKAPTPDLQERLRLGMRVELPMCGARY